MVDGVKFHPKVCFLQEPSRMRILRRTANLLDYIYCIKLTGRASRGAQGGQGCHDSEGPRHLLVCFCSEGAAVIIALSETVDTEHRGGTRRKRSERRRSAAKMAKMGLTRGSDQRCNFRVLSSELSAENLLGRCSERETVNQAVSG